MIELLKNIPWQFYLIWGSATVGISIYCRVSILGLWLLTKFKYFDTKREIVNTLLVLVASLAYCYLKISWIGDTSGWWVSVLKDNLGATDWTISSDWWKQLLQCGLESVIGYLLLHTLTIRRYVYSTASKLAKAYGTSEKE